MGGVCGRQDVRTEGLEEGQGLEGCDDCGCGSRVTRETTWSFVGDGRGEYEQVRSFEFAGEGGGDWVCEEVKRPPKTWRPGPWATGLTWCLAIAAVAGVVLGATSGGTAGQSLSFDCAAGRGRWREEWPSEQQEWCCRHAGHGCPERASTTPVDDCRIGLDRWLTQWSVEKVDRCCGRAGVRCTTTSALPFDCSVGAAVWQQGWSRAKKRWCCERTGGAGCALATTAAPFDCPAHAGAAVAAWPSTRRAWCCRHAGVACEATTFFPFDCNDMEEMSVAKAQWCCKNMGTFCMASTSTPDLHR